MVSASKPMTMATLAQIGRRDANQNPTIIAVMSASELMTLSP